ncbi:P44/Msp2 family outer membrane protein [Wolbachia endosymbiont (group E) of Neria commutata]|uniref:P44/Msp2 family outer membrane protein n=1 Tax=Wolbachia endosymbiont (group E) of Neria commutata TaxID=3066149 RepID=UPI00313323B6
MLFTLTAIESCYACSTKDYKKSYVKLFYSEVLFAKLETVTLNGKQEPTISKKDFAFFGGFALGYNQNNIRSEFEVINSRVKYNSDILYTYAGIANFQYEYNIENIPFTPYLGIGMGFGIIPKVEVGILEDKLNDYYISLPILAYQCKCGIDYQIAPEMKVSIDYRYL